MKGKYDIMLPKGNSCPSKVDIILIQPNIVSPYKIVNLPYGPLFLASSLRRAGYRVLIFDDRLDDRKDLVKALRENRILFVGFTIFTGPIILDAIELSRFIKQASPDTKIVWGGPHPDILPEQTVINPNIDIVCRGEGEITSVELADALKDSRDISSVKGLTFKRNGKPVHTEDRPIIRDWDKEVSMALDLINLKRYIFDSGGLKTIHIITSKGCPFRCSFCWNLLCTKRIYRAWGPKKIEREIQPLVKAGVKRIVIDDAFMGPEKRIVKIGELFKDLGLVWAIEDGFRVDVHKTDSLFQSLKDTECHHVAFGAESGSQRILDLIHKDITLEQILDSARLSTEYGIGAKYSWMVGIPGETKADAIKTVRLIDAINKINPKIAHAVSLFAPYPGSELFNRVVQMGWKSPQRLEDWGRFREEMEYNYLDNMWFYKAIMYSNFLLHGSDSEYILWKQTKSIYSLFMRIFRPTAAARWKHRFFSFPFEYIFAEKVRGALKERIEK